MKTVKQYYGDSEGPLGIPMRSDVAKDVEKILAGLPADCKQLIQQANGPMRAVKVASAMDFAEGERADISFVTTDSVDRDAEVMFPQGADWSQFRKNPVVTFAHKYDELPPGRSLWLKRDERNSRKGWLAKTTYIERPADWPASTPWLPDAVWHYVKGKYLPGKSIGFIPMEVRGPSTDEIKARPELASVKRIIVKWLALEYAIAPVQCNPDALVVATAKARQKGLAVPDMLLEEFGVIIPDEVPSLEEGKASEPPKTAEKAGPDPERVITATSVQDALRKSIQDQVAQIDIAAIVRETINSMRGRV